MSKYLVKFISDDIEPPYKNPTNSTIKIGTFNHYRNIECDIRQDREEGQRGLDLILKRPCKKLDELIEKEEAYGGYSADVIDANGFFTCEYHLQIHEHLYEFNTWIFCCSIIDDLKQIDSLKERFNSSHYYFIPDLDSFILKIQKALSEDLKKQPLLPDDVPRVVYPVDGNFFIDGYKDIVKYTDESTNYVRTECETLSEYINSKRSRALDRALWFKKQNRFKEDSEFRIIFYACNKRGEGAETYSTNDDYLILPVDLTGSVSKKALPIK
jgi:hypothetical protein